MNMHHLIDSYISWLKEEISINQIGEYCEITTPFLDRFNDYLQIYIHKNQDGKYELTDDGEIINNLKMGGIDIFRSAQRRNMLLSILRNYSVQLKESDLCIEFTEEKDFPLKKQLLIQAMLSVDDMFNLKSETIKHLFTEDISRFFDTYDIYYTQDFPMIGKTGSMYNYDFHFQRTKTKNERFCKAINYLREDTRNLTIFNWIDTQERRTKNCDLIVLINDVTGPKLESDDISAFETYGITSVPFSQRTNYIDLFTNA